MYFNQGHLKGREAGHDFKGYVRMKLNNNGKQINVMQHRILYAYYHGIDKLDDSLEVNHINGVKSDNRKENLELVTPSENVQHKFDIGLDTKVGEKNAKSVLTVNDVLEVRERLSNGDKIIDLANHFGVTRSAIDSIKHRRTWSHI